MTETMQLPTWLDPTIPAYPTTKDQRDLQRLVHETVFESFLDHIIEGRSGTHFIRTDPRNLSYGRFMMWVRNNPDRNKRYEEAREIGTEAVLEDMKAIADAEDSTEDVQRSTLRVNVRKIEIQSWNRKRYGERAQVEQNVTIDLRGAIEEGTRRALQGKHVPLTIAQDE